MLPRIFKLMNILSFFYGGYLTLRYIDKWKKFPAIFFRGRFIRLKIIKNKDAQFEIGEQLIVEPWMGNCYSEITLKERASLKVHNDFILGDDVHIRLSRDASCVIEGRSFESGSGITARAMIMVRKKVRIGKDVIIAWNTYITDCDWHKIGGEVKIEETVIGNHVWISNNAQILRGSNIGDDSIVASNSVLIGKKYPEGALLGGIPAKVIKVGLVDWHR